METIDKDPVLAEFFSSMGAQDLRLKVPAFPEPKKKKSPILWIVSLGIAASLLLGVLFVSENRPGEKLIKDQVMFTLYKDALKDVTYFEVIEASSMDTWEPATQSLLDEF